jgi:hypothetical protein
LIRSSDCSSFESQSSSLDQSALSTPSSIANGGLSNSTSTFHSALSTPSSITNGGLSNSTSNFRSALSTPSSIANGGLSNSTSNFRSALSTPSSIANGGNSNSTSTLGPTLSQAEQQLLLAYRQLNSPSFVPYPAGAVSSEIHPAMAGLRLASSSCRQANQGVPPNLLGSNSTNPAAVMLTAPNPPSPFRSTIEQEELLRQQFINGISMNLLLRR